ncbi:MAG: hypothetical protein IJA19_06200 [Clostridia bacterium]|nr:hypothetical protein [Clostridia bacterium]
MIKHGFKFLLSHFYSVIISLLIIASVPVSVLHGNGKYILWTVLLLINLAFLYSAGWNLGAQEKHKSPLLPLKASLISFVVPVLLIIISLVPVNNWRYYKMPVNLEQGKIYTLTVSGTENSMAKDLTIVANPDYDLDGENYIHPDVLENIKWNLTDGAVVTNENYLVFQKETNATKDFTVDQSREYYLRGYYKGTGEMDVTIMSGETVLAVINPAKATVTKNIQIFRVASTAWYMPLSLLFNNLDGNISIYNVLYLMLVLPIVVTLGYMIGTTNFSVLEKIAVRKQQKQNERREKAIAERNRRKKY